MWLNNPLRPLEACGTSGMKSALNGGLNLSIRDGWWDEWYDGENGWEIPTADGLVDESRRDDLEAAALYDLLEKRWRRSSTTATTRPADALGGDGASHADGARPQGAGVADGARLHREVLRARGAVTAQDRRTGADGEPFGAARELAVVPAARHRAWPKIQITDVDSYGLPDTPLLGSELTLTATVQLAGLRPDRWPCRRFLAASTPPTHWWSPVTVSMQYRGTADGGNEIFRRRAAAGRGAGGLHGAGIAPSPAAGRRQRARPRHTRIKTRVCTETFIGNGQSRRVNESRRFMFRPSRAALCCYVPWPRLLRAC